MFYIKQALKGKNDWWRVLIVAGPILLLFSFNFIMFLMLTPEQMAELIKSANIFEDKNLNLIANLLPFVFLLGFLFLFFYLLHQRNLVSLTTSRNKIDFKRIFLSIFIVIIIQVIYFAISYLNDSSDILWNFDLSKFAVLVVICLIMLPIQIGFEEYFFRGYLMQQIGIKTNSIWIPLIVTSVLFGLVHSANPEVSEIGFKMMFFYIGTGLFMGIMTLLDEGLELALGFHFANNFVAATLITSEFSALQTDAIFTFSGEANTASMFNETVITMLITYPLILLLFSKLYKWNWQNLFKKPN
jgi:membrane protease YdiL (CAAX protease family)